MPEVFQAGVPLSLPSNKIIAQGPANVCFSPSFCCWLYLHYWNFAHFFFFSFQKTDLSFACAVLPHKNNPYFCGNTGESRVLSGTFKSLQFHNYQTEGDLQTEGAKVQVFYHNAFYRLETKSIHRQTHFTPSSLKEKLIWYFESNTYWQTETTIFFINDCKVVVWKFVSVFNALQMYSCMASLKL